ncbi:MAG: holo-ACP synthase [Synergistaceae bacterium]
MISGIGVDLCDINRIRKAVARPGFKEKVFSKEEIKYAENSNDSAKHYAAAFASREAIAKATGWGLFKQGICACSIIRTENGPHFVFNSEFQKKLKMEKIKNVFLSISHESGLAIAMVVLEKENV